MRSIRPSTSASIHVHAPRARRRIDLSDRVVRAALAAITAIALAAAGGCGPGAHHDLAVTTFSPSRVSDGKVPIVIRFDRPVVEEAEVGRAITDAELTLRPATAWHGHWQDRQTLLITPDGDLQPSTKYTVKLAGLLARRTGGFGFAFVHQPLAVEGLVGASADAERLTTTGPWTLGTSLPVAGKAVAKRCQLVGAKGKVALVALEPDAVGTETQVEPQKPLAPDVDYRLTCSGLAAAAGDAPMPEPWTLDVHTLSNLFVKSALPVGRDVAADEVTLELVFSTPVTLEAARKAVKASPAIPGIDRGWLDGGGTRYRVTADLETDTEYTVTVDGLIDAGGQHLAAPFEHEFQTGDASPRIEIERGIFALEASAPGYPLWSRNLPAYDVECGRIPTDKLVQALTTDMNYDPWGGSDDSQPIGWKELGVTAAKQPITVAGARNKWHLDNLELGTLCGGGRKGARGVYLADVTSKDIVADGSWRNRGHRALVNVTDLGVMIKAGPASGLVWVTSLATGAPVAGAKVTVYTPQGKAVHTGTTDADGLVRTPGSAKLLEQPSVDDTDAIEEGEGEWEDWDSYRAQRLIAIVEKAGDVAVVDGNWANGIQIWNFGVPEDRSGGATKIRGFIQSDRGLYRPGEEVHFKGLVRELAAGHTPRPPAGLPVAIEVSDSRGATLLNQTVAQTAFGGFAFDLALSEDAALGDYYVNAKVGTQTFHERFQVEEFRPATFEVKLAGTEPRIRPGDRLEVGVDAQYLFGAPVAGAEVSWSVSRRDHALRFAGFDAYSFDDDRRWWWYGGDDEGWWDVQVADGGGTTDLHGAMKFVVRDDDASFTQPRDYLISAQVTDAASQTIGARTVVVAHPTDVYLGVFTQEYVQAVGMPFAVNLVAVDPAGKRVAHQATLRFVRQVQDCRWDQAGYRSYASCTSHEEVALERTVDIPATGTATEKILPKEPGDYVVKVSTVDGRGKPVVASSGLWVIGKGEAFWSGDESARMMLVASKPTYQIGDTARLSAQAGLKAPTALLTIERDGILDARVVKLASSSEGLEVTIAPDWAPNVFASVVMVSGRQGPLDRERPMMKMGVVELKVSAEQRRLQVAIATDRETYEPGETVSGTVTVTSAGKPVAAEVALSAADEGVLSLIDYRTPDPMKTFYASFGLGVDAGTNWNRIARLADPGADDPDEGGDGGSESSRVRSRFVASAYWAPALVTDARGVARFSFTAPDSLTAYRLMAVAADAGDRFGNGERRVTVTKQLIAQPVLPRFFTVGDTASIGVIVHNHTGAAGTATVRATTTGVRLASEQATIDVPADGQATVRFAATVDEVASAKVQFAVAMNGARDALVLELPIERPRVRTPRLIASTKLAGGVPLELAVATPAGAIAAESDLAITVDRTGLGDLEPSLRYLVEYPYGCLEQTLSRFVPLAKAKDLAASMRLASLEGTRMDAFLAAGVAKVARHQQGDGHFSLWPQSETHPHLTVYALWGLREARKAGVDVPEEVFTRGRAALQGWIESGQVWKGTSDLAVVAMAAWLFADAGTADHGLIARLYDARATMPRWGLAFLARAMKLAGTDGKQLAAVVKLLEAAVVDGRIEDRYPESDYHMSSSVRASAMTLSALLEVAPRSPAIAKLQAGLLAARGAAGRWESTQDNVWSLIAFADLARKTSGAKATVTVRSGSRTLQTADLEGSAVMVLHASQADVAGGLTITSSAPMHVDVRATDVTRDAGDAIANGFTIAREYLGADGKPATTIHAGDLLTVRLTVTTTNRRWVAMVDHIPAGFEAVNPNLATSAGTGRPSGTRDWMWSHQELRDDQVRWFADDLWASTEVLAYQVRATLPGTFYAGPATIEAMYEPSQMARTAAQTLTVLR